MLLVFICRVGASLLTDNRVIGARLLTDNENLLFTKALTRTGVGGHTLAFPDQKHSSVTTIPTRKPNTQTANMRRLVVERRVGLVEMAAIHILSEPLYLHEVRDGLVRGTLTATPATIQGWPLLLTREQLCDYLQVSWSSLSKRCPVPPIELGVNVVRYSRLQIDDWIASLPPRDKEGGREVPVLAGIANPAPEELPDARLAALQMARERSARRK